MKSTYLLIFAALACCLGACKKDNTNGNNSNQITGKWYETKMEIHESNGTAVDRDTIFAAESFTSNDYFRFTGDMKAVFSQSGFYNFTGKSIFTSGGLVTISLAHYNYSINDGQLKLVSTDIYPSNVNGTPNTYQLEDDIVQLDDTHLVLHTHYNGPPPYSLTSTMYFTKGK